MMAHVTVQTLFQKHLSLMEDHIYGNVELPQVLVVWLIR